MNRILAIVICAGLAGACGSKPAAPSSPDVWAVVDGREIRRDDVEKTYRRMTESTDGASEEEILAAKLSVLNELIVQHILAAKAPALKVEISDDEVTKAFNDRKQNMSAEAFQAELTKRGLTEDDMRSGLRLELLAQKVVDHEVGAKIAVTEQEIIDFFNANRSQFNLAEPAYHVAQIVITPVKDAQIANRQNDDATTPEAAARKVDMLLERLRGGATFADLAADYSEDPQSAPRGGDLGFITHSALQQIPPVLRDVVLKTEPGTVKTVSQGGAHTLVMVVAREAAGQRDLSMPGVKENITSTLRERKEQVLRNAYLTTVRNDSTVVNYLARQIVDASGKPPSLAPTAPGR